MKLARKAIHCCKQTPSNSLEPEDEAHCALQNMLSESFK